MGYQKIQVPANGDKITVNSDNTLNVPNNPIIPYIEGDGIGVDISPVMIKVVDAAVEKAYGGERKIAWMEVYAGEKATQVYDQDTWLPKETLEVVRDYVVSIKGPLTTPEQTNCPKAQRQKGSPRATACSAGHGRVKAFTHSAWRSALAL